MFRNAYLRHVLHAFLLFLLTFSLTTCRNVNRQQYRLIERYMDTSVDPCKDFYKYACGNWEHEHASDEYSEAIGLIDYQVNHEYARILNKLRKQHRRSEHKFVSDVLDYHKSCMSVELYRPAEYLEWLTEHENIAWPSVLPINERKTRQREKRDYDWLRLLATLRRYGLNGVLLEETVLQRRNDAQESLIDLDKPVLNGGFQPLPFKALKLTMEYLDVTEERRIEEVWAEMQLFELRLVSLDDIEDEEAETKVRAVAGLSKELPWLERYLSTLLNRTLDAKQEITIQNLPYMKALFELLDEYESEFLYRYLMVRFLWYLNTEVPRNFLKNDCIAHTRGVLSLAMHWLYEQHNPELLAETPHIEALFRNLTQHFGDALQQNSYHFNATVLKFLRAKLDSMYMKVGNLPRPTAATKLDDFYLKLHINVSDFYGNHLRALRYYFEAKHALLHASALPATPESFFDLEDMETGAISSPYYLRYSNVVIVPLTLLHAPIYQLQMHDVFKYSSLGFLLAHEIMHAFDDSGVEYDQHGNMRGPSQLIRANKHFDDQLECLRAKGPDIIDEKRADVSGLRWAFEAYFKNSSTEYDDDASSLRWTGLPPKRLFFLNFAQFFCGTSSTDVTDTIDYSEHGPDRQRVLDILANFAEFGRVYQCPLGSPMHPQKKCQLWR